MNDILVIGGKGKLGSELMKLIDADFLDIDDIDITNKEKIQSFIEENDYIIIIHLAAETDLNRCEKDKDHAFRTNVLATRYIAESALKILAYLIYPSTDYVFDGNKGMYKEDDAPNPINYYSLTKLLAEYVVRGHPEHLILRGTMKEREKWRHPFAPSDMYESLLHHDEYAEFMVKLIERNAFGTYHVGKGRSSVYEWAHAFDPDVKPKTIEEIGFPLPRDCSLDTTKFENFLKEHPRLRYKIRKE